MMVSKGKHYANGLKSSNRSKGFTKVDTLNLSVTLCHKTGFVPDDLTIFIEFVAVDPLCPDDIVNSRIRPFYQFLDIIQFKLKKFVLHCLNPFRFLQCLSNFGRL